MRAEILSIGTELLVGSIVNSNARFLSEKLVERGVDVYRHATVGDNVGRLVEAMNAALGRSDVVICSGGLGPTEDDVTMEAAARALGRPRVFHRETARRIRERLKAARIPRTRLSMNQCSPPEGAALFQNENGTAPGVLCETRRGGETKYLLLLPGPPPELEPMFEKQAWPAIAAAFKGRIDAFAIRTVKIGGLAETQVADRLGDLLKSRPPLTCGIYASAGEVQLKIMSKARTERAARAAIAPVEKRLRRIFGKNVVGVDGDTPASTAVSLLKRRKRTLALAESCTGGLVSNWLTDVPGASSVFRGAVVAYANTVKEKALGVSRQTLSRHGAVSAETAREMAQGARRALDASIGISITGIAGPSGDTAQKPVGLVYIALSDTRGTVVRRHRFVGSRDRIRQKAARAALQLLRLHLL